MGLYDNFRLPSSDQYVSTYAGVPIQELSALGDTIGKKYDKGLEGVSAFNVMRDNVQVDEADMELKDSLFDDAGKSLKSYAESGDYENAYPAISQATSKIAGNKDLRKAKSAYIEKSKHQDALEKMYNDRKINADQYKYALGRLGEYKGISGGDSIRNHMYTPAEAVNVQKMLMDIGKNVKTEEKSYYINDGYTGKRIKRTETAVNQEELEYVMRNAIQNDPKIRAYHEDLTNMYGGEAANQMIEQELTGAFSAVEDGIKYKDQYISKDHKALANANTRQGSTASGYQYVPVVKDSKSSQSITNKVDQIDTGYDFGEIDDLNDDVARGNLIDVKNKIAFSGPLSWVGDIATSVTKFLTGSNASDKDIETFKKYETATKNYYNISDEKWNSISDDEKNELGNRYIEQEGISNQQLGYRQLNVNDAKASGLVGQTANPDDQAMLDGASDYIKTNKNSITFYDIESGEQISLNQSDHLKDALNEKAVTGGIRVMGETDYKNPYAIDNSALADSYYITAYDEDGKEKTYLATKPDKHYKNPSQTMMNYGLNVSNGDYSGVVADISNTFKMASYPESYDYGNVKIDGSKAGKNTIMISSLNVGGNDIDLQEFSEKSGIPYMNGNLVGLTYDDLAKYMFLWNASK